MSAHPWPHDDLADDFRTAVCGREWGQPTTALVGMGQPPVEPLREDQVAEVVRYHVSYHSVTWQPGVEPGTELSLLTVMRLTDGRWASVVAWNDYTGWGCQDASDVRIGATEQEVVTHGLDAEARRTLGYEATERAS